MFVYRKQVLHFVPCLYQYTQDSVCLAARPGGYALGYFLLYHTRTAGNQILIFQHFEEYLPDYKNLDELKAHYTRGGLGDVKVKKFLNKVLQAELSPIRERRKYWEQHLDDVYDILKEGSKVAEAKAAQTLHDVRSAMQINYFDDNSLIK